MEGFMIETWFISDTHFFHKNILEYEKEARPFDNLEEMHEVMIERWNSAVGKNDIVYHLGDFCFGRHNIDIGERLSGKIRLVMGNHDIYPVQSYLTVFEKVYGMIYWKRCVLSHIPVHPDNLGQRYLLNVHGHLHSRNVMDLEYEVTEVGDSNSPFILTKLPDKNYFNVSCEQNNLTPIHSSVIMDRLKEIDK